MTANGFGAAVANPGTEATFQRCEVSGNVVGLTAAVGGLLRVSGSTVTRNTSFGLAVGPMGATLESFHDRRASVGEPR